ncbi:MAG: metallophosphoesterase [Ruminococcaceae bacterium]|nr:metallophosphoesterase [Oscillospiraceae bacterium]
MQSIPKAFLTAPIVYAVNRSYQIMVPVTCELVMWAEVGGKCFYDDSNGILRSSCSTHRMTVPMELLDREKHYRIGYRVIRERKPYFTEAEDVAYYESDFRPIEREPIHMYHIADAHNEVERPVSAASFFGKDLDLLILNGDIPNHSGAIEYFASIHQIAGQLTNGEIPVIFSRGNHDMRGNFAEVIADHTPTDNGRSYYTFRLGSLWGMVLDCAEDKPDDHPAYGFMNCCEDFRRRETEFIKSVIANADSEYQADGVENRIVIVHNPFTQVLEEPFNIETELYREWATLLREDIKPNMMICGHMHKAYISHVGDETDHLGQPCPVVVASQKGKECPYAGGAFVLYSDRCDVKITDDGGNICLSETLHFQ